MLFSGLQAQHIGAAAFGVRGLAHDAAGQLAHVLFGGGHVAQIGATGCQRQAQRLTLAHGDVRAAVTGRFHDGQRDGVAAHDIHGARLMDGGAQRLRVLEQAVEVGLLHIEGGGIRRQHLPQGVGVGLAVLFGNDAQLVAGAVAVGADGVDHVGMGGGGHQRHPALAVTAHGGGLGGGGGAVVHGGVGHVHAGEHADHGLILKDGLQQALAHLRLIGGVGRQEFFLGGNVLDDAGDIVVVGAGAPEDHVVHPVLRRHGADGAARLQLAHAGGDLQRPVQIHLRRHIAVQLTEGGQADGLQHLLPLRRRGGDIAAHISPPARRRLRKRRRPAAPRCRRCSPP